MHSHPITISIDKISRIFSDMGFDTIDGPEIEDEWHNFDALNVPKDHPARDMQDTFWIKDIKTKNKYNEDIGHVLRTHTSGTQIRTMEKWIKEKLEFPIAVCIPGKVYRNEATDATHEAQFHQIEMLYIGKDASLAMMIGVTQKFLTGYFDLKEELKIRLRSSYFPFTEPSNEIDMKCFKCLGSSNSKNSNQESKCSVCRGSGWIELGGAGMVHPRVLEAGGINPNEYRGFAFGCGIDRLAMLKWNIDDIRLLYKGDLRLVDQF